MGNKTKKQKIIADLRRQVQISQQSTKYSLPTNQDLNQKSELSKLNEIRNPIAQTQSIYSYPVQLIRKDLTKTLLLCILGLSLEVALYFFLGAK